MSNSESSQPEATTPEPTTAAAKPVASSKKKTVKPSADANSSNKRQYILLGLLGILLIALGYDYLVARPKVDAAFALLEVESAKVNRNPTDTFTKEEVQQVLGQTPAETYTDSGGNLVEVYKWASAVPLRSHKMWVSYQKFGDEDIFYRQEKFVTEGDRAVTGLVSDDKTDDYVGAPQFKAGSPEALAAIAANESRSNATEEDQTGDDMGYDAETGIEPAEGNGDPAMTIAPVEEISASPEPDEAESDANEEEETANLQNSPRYKIFEAQVAKYDKDGDGRLAGDELTPGMKASMAIVDIDHNDILDVEEIMIFADRKK